MPDESWWGWRVSWEFWATACVVVVVLAAWIIRKGWRVLPRLLFWALVWAGLGLGVLSALMADVMSHQ